MTISASTFNNSMLHRNISCTNSKYARPSMSPRKQQLIVGSQNTSTGKMAHITYSLNDSITTDPTGSKKITLNSVISHKIPNKTVVSNK